MIHIKSYKGLIVIKEDPTKLHISGYGLIDIIKYPNSYDFNITKELLKIVEIPLKEDGILEIYHIIAPTKDYFEKYSSSFTEKIVILLEGSKLKKATLEKDGYIISEITCDDLLTLVDNLKEQTEYAGPFVSVWFLKKCYINLCKLIFEQRGFSACFNNKIDSELIYKRDLLWMALNVIEYYTRVDETEEAQRIMDIITGCNGLCSKNNINNKSNGCGCGK